MPIMSNISKWESGSSALTLSHHLFTTQCQGWTPGTPGIIKFDLEIFHPGTCSRNITGWWNFTFLKKKIVSSHSPSVWITKELLSLCLFEIWDLRSVQQRAEYSWLGATLTGVTLSITIHHKNFKKFKEFSSGFSWKQLIFEIPTSRETREVKEKNSNVSMSRTILLAISITIQKRRNFFQENWVWNHFARILMWRETTSLSLGWTCWANLCWTTGILREFSCGGGPSLWGLGLGLGAILYCYCAVTVSQAGLEQHGGHCTVRRGTGSLHIPDWGDVDCVLVSTTLGPDRTTRTAHQLCAPQPQPPSHIPWQAAGREY